MPRLPAVSHRPTSNGQDAASASSLASANLAVRLPRTEARRHRSTVAASHPGQTILRSKSCSLCASRTNPSKRTPAADLLPC
ncbi:hypothetical protein KFK09_012565 [Dendrobium nobile]|uniref:Uncharacterized protein n=1 Tax=Dendrobium nobile TaxID=94219 RepID=A0A8T3BJA9_DENNO|nr:hypothetical protein KFK09_012565 [Dendrobium nobile]